MKFDIVMSNPPYNGNLDIKILKNVHSVGNEFVIVHPSTWVLDMKHTFPLYNTYRDAIEGNVVSLEFFNGNPIFGIESWVPIVITHINKDHTGNIKVKYFDSEYECDSIYDVTKFGKDWFTIVKPFADKIKKALVTFDSVWYKRMKPQERTRIYCQLADVRGTPHRGDDSTIMYLNDFYTLVTKSNETNEDIRKEEIKNTYRFDTVEERDNFLEYCKTYFARFCVAIYKNNSHLDSGEMNFLPYLDFTESWSDEKLFKFFDIDDPTQQYIKTYLPDFYN
jgi:hypothetical protein